MIESILDNDLYKLTMQQAVHALYPRAEARYTFIDRGETTFPEDFDKILIKEIGKMEDLQLSDEEFSYLKENCYFLTPVYLDFLRHYRFDPSEVKVQVCEGRLHIDIEGPWFRTILWEVPLMALVSELYFSIVPPSVSSRKQQQQNNSQKASKLRDADVHFADFGTRRRFSYENHEQVLDDILNVKGNTLLGTSNVHLARKFKIKPIGTHAHEWFMFHAAQNGYLQANKLATDAWIAVYQGNLGIALTDTYTTDLFLRSFDSLKARLFDGVRQDSGDPIVFAEKLVGHYQKLRIDPKTKTIVFSDGLDTEKAVEIQNHCGNQIKASFGIGTHLTNDLGPKALNMVIKLSECRADTHFEWIPAVKLSDTPGKHTGTKDEIDMCIRTVKRSAS